MSVKEINHPLVKHKLGLMREHDRSTRSFRQLVSEVGSLLTYEATADLPLEDHGLGMLDGVLELVPSAKVSVVGLYRDEETLEPVTYFEKLAGDIDQRMALVVDPMLATGGSMLACIDMLKAAGCKQIRALVLVAAPEGIAKVLEAHPDVEIYTASVDSHLDDNGYIVPGLGDAGDKIFGTR